MTAANWENYIHTKADFYAARPPVVRNDTEFTWSMTARAPTWRRHLKKLPFVGAIHNGIKLRRMNPVTRWDAIPQPDLEALYEVRCLLADEVSRITYDEAIILRMASCHRFFFTRNAFDDVAQVRSVTRFGRLGLPTKYQGLPIEQFGLTVDGADINVVAASGFADMLNIWQQYLVKRDGLNFRPLPGEIVFDCGACVGDVSTVFAAMVGQSGRVFAFDPIPLHQKICAVQREINPALADTLNFISKAVGAETRRGSNDQSEFSEISPGAVDIDSFDMTTLDGFVADQKLDRVDFIKMDIEGAERDALKGAEATIRKFKPKLAISTYHRPDDFWVIPLQIRDLRPDYKFAFGHHSPKNWESVIYAY